MKNGRSEIIHFRYNDWSRIKVLYNFLFVSRWNGFYAIALYVFEFHFKI